MREVGRQVALLDFEAIEHFMIDVCKGFIRVYDY